MKTEPAQPEAQVAGPQPATGRALWSRENSTEADRVVLVLLLCAGLLEIVLGTTVARTHLPLCDEGFYGVPAHTLSTTGFLKDDVLESAGISYLYGVDRKFYWMAPGGIILQAAAFVIFGFSLMIQRELSVFCGMGAILCWYLTLKWLLPRRTAALAALLLSLDFVFLSLCSLGRSDIISLFLGSVALASYMNIRGRSLPWALAIASSASAFSGLVHPNGGIAALTSLVIIVFGIDRDRLRWSYLPTVMLCYGVVGLAWIVYIAKAPDLFAAQFLGNVANRFAHHRNAVGLLAGEAARYVSAYGLEEAHGLKLVLYAVPAACILSVAFCCCVAEIRQQKSFRLLLLVFLGLSLSLVCLEGSKQGWYLVHLSPVFASFLAISVSRLWQSAHIVPRLAASLQILIVLLGAGRLCFTSRNQHLQRFYQPAVAYLNNHMRPSDLAFARSEFYFGLRYRSCLRDDPNLGIFSGRRAEFIVVDQDYKAHWASLRQEDKAAYGRILGVLDKEYQEVFSNIDYRIFQRSKHEVGKPGS